MKAATLTIVSWNEATETNEITETKSAVEAAKALLKNNRAVVYAWTVEMGYLVMGAYHGLRGGESENDIACNSTNFPTHGTHFVFIP